MSVKKLKELTTKVPTPTNVAKSKVDAFVDEFLSLSTTITPALQKSFPKKFHNRFSGLISTASELKRERK